MDELTLDGNGMAGLLGEIAGADMTSVHRTCQSCGDRRAMGEHRAYRSAGVVLRCPSCEDVAVVIGMRDERLTVAWHGTYEVARPSA